MGGMSGSSLADAAMEAKLLVPDMVKAGYPNGYASAITAFSSMITPLIPPGIAAIIYGSVTGTSIGKLFVAGIVPAIILCAAMMIIVSKYSKKRGIPRLREKHASGKELWKYPIGDLYAYRGRGSSNCLCSDSWNCLQRNPFG